MRGNHTTDYQNKFILAGFLIGALLIPLTSQTSLAAGPAPIQDEVGSWTMSCEACLSPEEPTCQMSPKNTRFGFEPNVWRSAGDAPDSLGTFSWEPPKELSQAEGRLTFRANGQIIAEIPPENISFGDMNGEFYIDSPYADAVVETLANDTPVTIEFADNRGSEYDQSETIAADGFAAILIRLLHRAPQFYNFEQCPEDRG